MRREVMMPDEVRSSIADHIRSAVDKFHRTYDSTSSNEDSLTVKLGEVLNTRRQRVVEVSGFKPSGKWKWKLVYTKFSDRSRNSEEKHTGADGVLELISGRSELGRKTALFQCKKKGSQYSNTLEQAAKLSNWREAAFFIEFAKDGSSAINLDDVVRDTRIVNETPRVGLADYLIESFLACKVGDGDLEYFADKKRLSWRTQNGETVQANFLAKHRFNLEIFPPWRRWRKSPRGELLPLDRIHDFRLDAAYEGLEQSQLKSLVKIYHPDRLGQVDFLTNRAFESRLREVLEIIREQRNIAVNEEKMESEDLRLEEKNVIDLFSVSERSYVRPDEDESS